MAEETPAASHALHLLDLPARLVGRVPDGNDLHERRRVLEALDGARVERTGLLQRLGRLHGAERLGVEEREVVARRDRTRVALQGLLVVLLRRAEVPVDEPDVSPVHETAGVARRELRARGVLEGRAVVLAEGLIEAAEQEPDVHVVGRDVLGGLEVVENTLVVARLLEGLGAAEDRRRGDREFVGEAVQRREEGDEDDEGDRERDLLVERRVPEHEDEEKQRQPDDVEAEEQRQHEHAEDEGEGRAAAQEAARRLPQVVNEAAPVADEQDHEGGERRRGHRPEHEENEAREVHAARLAVGDRRTQRAREAASRPRRPPGP